MPATSSPTTAFPVEPQPLAMEHSSHALFTGLIALADALADRMDDAALKQACVDIRLKAIVARHKLEAADAPPQIAPDKNYAAYVSPEPFEGGSVESWLESALNCTSFNWDVDQHEMATYALEERRAQNVAQALSLVEPQKVADVPRA